MIEASPHPGQSLVHDSPARFKVLAAGRRWGKTRLGVNECLDTAARGGRAWWVAPTYKVSQVGWRPLSNMAAQAGCKVRKADREIDFPGGGHVAVRSADNPDSLRGEGLDKVVVDECAFIAEQAWSEALRPALSDRRGRAIFISSPRGRNWFWRLFQMGLAGNHDDWESWQLPTSTNPYIAPDEIEAARELLPEAVFQQEYLAEFLEGQGQVFRNIAACIGTSGESHVGHHIVAGVDWGKQNDFTAISIGCADCREEIAIDRFNKIDYAVQRQRLMSMCERHGVGRLLAESNAMGEPIIEQLFRDGLRIRGFQTTAQSKPPLIENLGLVFEREEWRFLDDPVWTGELEAYERQISPTTGRSSYSAPAGLHDDTVIARALMVQDASRRVRLI